MKDLSSNNRKSYRAVSSGQDVRKDLEKILGHSVENLQSAKPTNKPKRKRIAHSLKKVDAVLGLASFIRECSFASEVSQRNNSTTHVHIAHLIQTYPKALAEVSVNFK